MGSRWKAYLPTFRWGRFRLCHESKDGAYMPIRMTQIVGGKWWSLSLTRTAPARVSEPTDLESAMHSVWLHGNWRWLTQKMTTEEREAAAAAVQRYNDNLHDEPESDVPPPHRSLRWWADDDTTATATKKG